MNRELPDVQAGFKKGRGTRDQIANIRLDHRVNFFYVFSQFPIYVNEKDIFV